MSGMFPRLRMMIIALLLAGGFARAGQLDHGDGAIVDFAQSPALTRAVDSVCGKAVVFLGEEAHHAGGGTLALKTALVRQLVDRCGFTDVVFEGQVYDFLDFNRSLRLGTASTDQLADAIGGLWSLSRESDALIDFLYARAKSGRISVSGIDPNALGATARYSQDVLPEVLSRHLPPAMKVRCEEEFQRHNRWLYDDRQPFDDAAQKSLLLCAVAARASVGDAPSIAARSDEQTMAASYVAQVSDAIGADPRARENMMYENLVRVLDGGASAGHRKAIVWTATVHAIPDHESQAESMTVGQRLRTERPGATAIIAVSAFGGRYGTRAQGKVIADARNDSLEAAAVRQQAGPLAWMGRKAMAKVGKAPSRLLDHEHWTTADWSSLLDGVLVLREEWPAIRVREAKPRQPPKAGRRSGSPGSDVSGKD